MNEQIENLISNKREEYYYELDTLEVYKELCSRVVDILNPEQKEPFHLGSYVMEDHITLIISLDVEDSRQIVTFIRQLRPLFYSQKVSKESTGVHVAFQKGELRVSITFNFPFDSSSACYVKKIGTKKVEIEQAVYEIVCKDKREILLEGYES